MNGVVKRGISRVMYTKKTVLNFSLEFVTYYLSKLKKKILRYKKFIAQIKFAIRLSNNNWTNLLSKGELNCSTSVTFCFLKYIHKFMTHKNWIMLIDCMRKFFMCANFTYDTYFDLEHVRQFPSDKIYSPKFCYV